MYDRQPYGLDDDNSSNYITQEDYEKDLRLVEQKLPGKIAKTKSKIKFIEDVIALYRYLKDANVKWYRKAVIVTALLYFISPIDSIPDFAPLVGYLDDFGVIMAAIKFIGSEIKGYYRYDNSELSDEV